MLTVAEIQDLIVELFNEQEDVRNVREDIEYGDRGETGVLRVITGEGREFKILITEQRGY
jgi:hypothetical protein